MTNPHLNLPDRIAQLPTDDRSGLPVPFTVGRLPNGRPDFSQIDLDTARRCSHDRLCGVCGYPLDYWIAFIGGESAVRLRQFVDPPMHRECAETSLRICPHIARRLPVVRHGVRQQPDAYYLYLCRGYRPAVIATKHIRAEGFQAAPAKTVHRYTYTGAGGQLRHDCLTPCGR